MISIKFGLVLVLTVLSTVCTTTSLHETLIPRKANTSTTLHNPQRFLNLPIIAQILSLIFTPIEAVVSSVLPVICTFISFIVSIIDGFRDIVLSNLIYLIDTLVTLLSSYLQYSIPLMIVETILVIANETIGNLTSLVSTYGCTATSGIGTLIDNIFSFIIGIFE